MEEKEEKNKKLSMRDMDIILGLVFFGFFGWTAYEAIRMSKERMDKGMATIYTAPGLMPLIMSILILICVTYVIIYAFKQGGRIRIKEYLHFFKSSFLDEKTRTTLLVFLSIFVYIFILIGRIPFIPATIIYVLASYYIFKAGKPLPLIIIGVTFSVGIVCFFHSVVGTYFPAGLFWW